MGIRELKQNPSEVVSRVKAGEQIIITERGKPVARMIPIGKSYLQELIDSGRVSLPSQNLSELVGKIDPVTMPEGSPSVLEVLQESRRDRF